MKKTFTLLAIALLFSGGTYISKIKPVRQNVLSDNHLLAGLDSLSHASERMEAAAIKLQKIKP